MRVQIAAWFIGLGILLAPVVPAGAQSLADLARKEEVRRKAVRGAGKTYTNSDLVAVPAPPTPPAASSPAPVEPADAAGQDKVAPPTDKAPAKDQAYWGARINGLRDQLERDAAYAEAMQTRINVLTMDFTNRDDPVQRAQIGVDRQKAVNELARLQKAIEDDKKAIDDLEEEARRAGVPPGWLR